MTLSLAIRRARRAVEAMRPDAWVFGEPLWIDVSLTRADLLARQIEEAFAMGWPPPVGAHPMCNCFLETRGARRCDS